MFHHDRRYPERHDHLNQNHRHGQHWCDEATAGLIPKISDDLSGCAATLINAVYLKSSWVDEFSEYMTEGTWNASIRTIVWGVPIALVFIGLLILLFAYLRPSYTATVTEVGETVYTPSRTMLGGHSSSYYEVGLKVAFLNQQGAFETAFDQFGSTNPNTIPEIGDQPQISPGPSGMSAHPNRDLIGVGGGAGGIGGLFLVLLLLTMWRDKKRIHSLSHKAERNS